MRGLRCAGFRAWHGQAAAAVLQDRVLPEAALRPGIVAGYWPMTGEADPLPALRMLARAGWQTALPDVMNADGAGGVRAGALVFRSWPLERGMPPAGAFGIPAPPPADPVLRPDLVLVPLLAADRAGRRLGQGAGFYDRGLRVLRQDGAPILAVGWAMAAQVLHRVPDGPADTPLDWIVTERRAMRCRPQGRTQ